MNAFRSLSGPLSPEPRVEGAGSGRFTTILAYAPDGSVGAAVGYGARLASASGAALILADTLEPLPAEVQQQLPAEWDVPSLVREKKIVGLDRAVTRARRAGVTPEAVVLDGTPFDALKEAVERRPCDLLLIDAPPEGTPPDAGHEPASRLVHGCPCPVLLARAVPRRRRPRVLVAINASPPRSSEEADLATALMESARWFAEQLAGDLMVLCVWSPPGDGLMRWAGVSPAAVQRYQLSARDETRDELEQLIAPFRAWIARVFFEMGDPRMVIPDFAATHRIDLMVVGTVARTGLAARLLGNTAEVVWRDAPCSMLVVPRASVPALRHAADGP